MARVLTDSAADFMLSPVHAMVEQIVVGTDAELFNSHINHPDIIEWVRGEMVGEPDGSELLKQEHVQMVYGDHGSAVVIGLQEGLFEVHIQVLPEGRGKWSKYFFAGLLHIIFTQTDCSEILMRRPKGNLAALSLIRTTGAKYQFTSREGYVLKHRLVPSDIYTLTLQDWITTATGLRERGAQFHQRLTDTATRTGSDQTLPSSDENLRQIGAAFECFMCGNIPKGFWLYNRWALANNLAPAQLECQKPLTLNLGLAMVIVRENDMWVPSCQSQQQSSEVPS